MVSITLVSCLLFLIIAAATALICHANANGLEAAQDIPELSLFSYLPAICWAGLGISMLIGRTIRWINLPVPWVLVDRGKDRRAALVGGATMVIMGVLTFAIVLATRGGTGGFIVSSLLGALGILVLYLYCRHLRNYG